MTWTPGIVCLLTLTSILASPYPSKNVDRRSTSWISKREAVDNPFVNPDFHENNGDNTEKHEGSKKFVEKKSETDDQTPAEVVPESPKPPTVLEGLFTWPPSLSWPPTFSWPTFSWPSFELPAFSWPPFLGGQRAQVVYPPNYAPNFAPNYAPNFVPNYAPNYAPYYVPNNVPNYGYNYGNYPNYQYVEYRPLRTQVVYPTNYWYNNYETYPVQDYRYVAYSPFVGQRSQAVYPNYAYSYGNYPNYQYVSYKDAVYYST